ncbi:hypothetical protein GJ744_000695 [Endocarpon pusillum]|uniref:Protein kinase domain-containing protein n=1 Tax=Endocarpon pusillum TaxID=364733 RepID=A0A8H7AAG8_9EURO|nr:hypothetical protein GJ744_000695 [Endocarpon pusillum]
MDPVSFAFATISMVDICIKRGKDLYERCQAYKRAETELGEATLCIQDYWIKIEHQISALRTVWEALGERLQIHQNLVLQVLQGKLQNAINKFDSLIGVREQISVWDKIISKRGEVKRLKYAAYAKASLDAIIDDLEKWQRMFDPSWFFLARIAVPVIDQQLTGKRAVESKAISTVVQLRQAHEANEKGSTTTSIFLQAGYRIRERESIAFSSASTGRNSDQRVIIDHIPVRKQTDLDIAAKDVRDLARVLSEVDPALFGLLVCQGVIKVRDPSTEEITGFDLIFLIPPELDQRVPRSLRSLLSDQKTKYPLNERIHLAVSLARSIVFLHSSRFVHKNISPENIIVHQPSSDKLGTPVLVGFERFRFAEGRTYMSGDCLWQKNLYRHPKRQGLYPDEQYTMHHDIYSVGICLLEIGLWSSFVNYSDDQKSIRPGSDLPISELIGTKDQRKAAVNVKAILVEMARSRLPELMGKIYADTVVSCLTCLDKNNGGFGDEQEFEDEDGILVGVRYIEKVLFEIEKIVV